jgi:surface polysaccharide O-acyltransferase-like enzyme
VSARHGALSKWGLYFYNYFSPTTILASVCIYSLLLQVRVPQRWQAVVAYLAPVTLGVYLLHPMVLESLRREWGEHFPLLLRFWLDMPVTGTATLLLSVALVAIARRVPFVRRVT